MHLEQWLELAITGRVNGLPHETLLFVLDTEDNQLQVFIWLMLVMMYGWGTLEATVTLLDMSNSQIKTKHTGDSGNSKLILPDFTTCTVPIHPR